MARPLFIVAREIAAAWASPPPQAKTFLKAMHYLLGMDDEVAAGNADTVVRLFLMHAKDWQTPDAERLKDELRRMRKDHRPTNADFQTTGAYPICTDAPTHCELCDAALAGKFIDGHTYSNKRARMCVSCNLFLGAGLELGDGALYGATADGRWLHLHGTPNADVQRPAPPPRASTPPGQAAKVPLRFHIKRFKNRVFRKLIAVARKLFKRAA